MDAYGDKDSLEDIQRALEHYKVRTAVISQNNYCFFLVRTDFMLFLAELSNTHYGRILHNIP